MMTTTTLPDFPRRLPSADWVAVTVAVLGLLASRLLNYGPLYGLVALAVFGPPVLRELGLLKDHDEYTRGIMYRAGLHGFLTGGTLLLSNRLLRHYFDRLPDPVDGHLYISLESMYQTVILVYLVSYLIQYWGPRLGVFRILLAFAAINAVELVGMLKSSTMEFWSQAAVAVLPVLGGFIVLAFVVRRWPRIGGGLLLAILVFLVFLMGQPDILANAFWGSVSVVLQVAALFGASGIALLRMHPDNEH